MNRYFGVHVLDGEWHALLPRYLALADRVEGKRVLDIGCGTGIGASMLLEMGAERVDGVDHRPAVLDLANIKHDKESLDFHLMLWDSLDLPNDSYDVAVCLSSAVPVTDPNLLEEVRRILVEDGEYICSVELRTVKGLDSLLPRQGEVEPSTDPDLRRRADQAPQIGQLDHYFDSTSELLQSPRYGFAFKTEGPMAEGTEAVEPGAEETNAEEDADEVGRPDINRTLCPRDSDAAAVQMIFCGSEDMEAPAPANIRLPYYRIVERLRSLVDDLRSQTHNGARPAGATPPPNSRRLDEETTSVKPKPAGSPPSPNQTADIGSELSSLTEAYREARQNFERMRRHTLETLLGQERAIERLVGKLQSRENQSDTETTGVFTSDDIRPPTDRESGASRGSEDSRTAELEAEVARLKDERRRLRAEVRQRDTFIDQLQEQLDSPEAASSDDEEPADELADEASDTGEGETDPPEDSPDADEAAEELAAESESQSS